MIKGKVYENNVFLGGFSSTTWAKSEAQAMNNFKFQAKRLYNKPVNTILKIDGVIEEVSKEPQYTINPLNTEKAFTEISYCPADNTGECPYFNKNHTCPELIGECTCMVKKS